MSPCVRKPPALRREQDPPWTGPGPHGRRLTLTLALALLALPACSLAGPSRSGPERSPAPAGDGDRASSDEESGRGSPSGDPDSGLRPAPNPPAPTAGGRSYEVMGQRYTTLASAAGYLEQGLASWYGDEFAGRPTASGEIFDPGLLTAAHRTLPLGTWVEVTNLENGRSIRIRINDRGPFKDPHLRIIDVSYETARRLGIIRNGTARVEVRALTEEEVREMGGG